MNGTLFPDGRPVDEWLDDDDRAVVREDAGTGRYQEVPEATGTLRTDAPPILWQIDGWRNADGTWTAEVYASGHGFGRCSYQKSWRTAIDKAMAAANESAAKE